MRPLVDRWSSSTAMFFGSLQSPVTVTLISHDVAGHGRASCVGLGFGEPGPLAPAVMLSVLAVLQPTRTDATAAAATSRRANGRFMRDLDVVEAAARRRGARRS